MKIGIMDSGIGGVTVLKECLLRLPAHEYFYYADSKNAPYGTKSREDVYQLTKSAVDFLIRKGVEIIVIACNTATSAAVRRLRKEYDFPIIGMEPAIKPALLAAEGQRVLVTATELTLESDKFKELVTKFDSQDQIDCCPLTELVHFAEMGDFRDETVITYLIGKLTKFRLLEYGAIVLGCTHFPLFKRQFGKILPVGIHLIDGSTGTVSRVNEFVTTNSQTPSIKLFLSGQPLEKGEMFDKIQSILNN
jgi:glutamate racemase